MNNTARLNTRVLVIDDEESVRDSFHVILRVSELSDPDMDAAARALFDDAPAAPRMAPIPFEVDVAMNGKSGAQMVELAVAANRPYAAIFCDLRMPGWDGVETVEEIRRHDQRAEIVFITAYSDHSVETIIERAGANVGYFVKPFLTDEVRQLATKLVLDWNKARELEELMRTITSLRGEARDMERLLTHLLAQICAWVETDSAALLRMGPRGIDFCLGVGTLWNAESAAELVGRAQDAAQQADIVELPDGTTILPIQQFGLAVALAGRAKLTPDRRFLLRVFIEHASLAIRNSQMQAELVEQQRMASIGQAVGFILHDVRGPLSIGQTLLHYANQESSPFGSRKELLGTIEGCMREALDTISDTLVFARGTLLLAPEEVALAKEIGAVARVVSVNLERRGVALEVDVPSDLAVHADPSRLRRVLWNLLQNAGDAAADRAGARVKVSAAAEEGGVRVVVSDSGPGLSPELTAKLFTPFASVKREGTGFGLAIVKQIMDAHGGNVRVERRDDMTRFELFFPSAT